MSSKSLLLYSGLEKNYTHILHVQSNPEATYFGFNRAGHYGGVTPDTFNYDGENHKILSLESNGRWSESLLAIDGFLPNYFNRNYLYLSRVDTKQTTLMAWIESEEIGQAEWDASLFREQDIGKDVPVLLEYSPPPLDFENISSQVPP